MTVTLKLRDLPPHLRKLVQRKPKGQAANALPDLWLEQDAHGLRLMERRREDVCLALISTETLAALRERNTVAELAR